MAGLQDSLLPIFIEETSEGLALIEQLMIAWREQRLSAEILEEARRAAHTIKGTAGLVKREQSSAIARDLEEFLDSFNLEQRQFGAEDIARVDSAYTSLQDLLELARANKPEEQIEEADAPSATSIGADIELGSGDLINDFALPLMMKLHQNVAELDDAVKPVCCRFYLGGRQYYLPIEHVVEIAECSDITMLPYSPAFICGLVNLRGDVIPVLDLAAMEQRKVPFPNQGYLVIANCDKDLLAFISDTLPNLNVKAAGRKVDVCAFLEQYSVKAS